MKIGKKNACLKKKMVELKNENESLCTKIICLELENKTLHDRVALSNEKPSTSHKHLESHVNDLKNEKDALQKSNVSLNEKIKELELDNEMLHDRIASFTCKQSTSYEHEKLHVDELINENETLKKKSNELNEIVLKFTNGQKMLDNMLNSQKCVFDKGGLGYKPYLKQKYYKNYFVKATSTNDQIVCHYCNQNGHMSFRCPVKRNAYYGAKCIWVPKGIITNTQGPKSIWVPNGTT